jgi:hypothetical protein
MLVTLATLVVIGGSSCASPRSKVPVTAFLRIEDALAGLARYRCGQQRPRCALRDYLQLVVNPRHAA